MRSRPPTNEAAARGRGSEFIGQLFGQASILVGTAFIPGGAEADAAEAFGNVGRATTLLGDAGKLTDVTETAGRASALTGDAGKAAAIVSSRVAAAAESGVPAAVEGGVAHEAERLAQLSIPKNNVVWRPGHADFDSAAFKVIVGEPKFTPGGLPKGTIFDGTLGGDLEIKGGSSMLDSSYQLVPEHVA